MELIIDALACDLALERIAVPAYEAAALTDLSASREGRKLLVTLPATERNNAVLGHAADAQTAVRFNAALHRAVLSAGGAVLLAGVVRLLAAGDQGYRIEIREGGARWAREAARKLLRELPVEFSMRLTPTAICNGWSNSDPVKFLPVHRDEYPQQNSSTDLLPAERMLSVDDYHPFLNLAELLRALFADAGYGVRSAFFDSPRFRSLYMSGAYTSRDTTSQRNRMDFKASRRASVTVQASSMGRVVADPYALYNTVGNLVDTAWPQSVDAEGEPIPGLYNNGGCFAIENQRILFRPPTEVSVGFEYYLKYTTDHRILTRDRLKGIDSVWLGPGAEATFALSNRYEDRRGTLKTNFSYRVIVFDHRQGDQYRLTYSRNGVEESVWTSFAARSAQVATPAGGTVARPALQVLTGGSWVAYTGDWALYDGYIGETGQTTVEVRMRTPAQIVGPQSPKTFDTIYFYGAQGGMSFTLDKASTLRPVFTSAPGYNSLLTFADVARHPVRQSALLEAVQQLFNLRFYTDQAARVVHIEPSDDFYSAGEADWREKTDFAQPIVLADIAPEVHERRRWGYQAGDGAVARHDAQSQQAFGEWSVSIDSYAAKEGEKVSRNALFTPTINSQGHYLNAPSACVMQVGDRDLVESDGVNITPRIVRFCGLHPLPAGERWAYPAAAGSYPLAAFHFEGDDSQEGFTLCFEDRGGVSGLHRYYDRQIEQESTCQRITLSLRIEPHQYESLFTPGLGAPDIRTVFRLDTGQGEVRATLHTIGEYDPQAASVRCTFTRIPES